MAMLGNRDAQRKCDRNRFYSYESVRLLKIVVVMLFFSENLAVGLKAQVLSTDFYSTSCPNLQPIAQTAFAGAVLQNPLAPAALLRLSFHDCAVDGCEGSILLDSGRGGTDEKLAKLNIGIGNLQVIDIMKQATEALCPGVVSCADLVVLAGAFSIVTSGGPNIPILLGRRDGTSSSTLHADAQLLPPTASVDLVLGTFAQAGINTMETVALLGSHTLGVGHCDSIRNRLYPQLDVTLQARPLFALNLQRQCPLGGSNPTTTVQNDLTNIIFDAQYFRDVTVGQGLFSIDTAIATDPRTSPFVTQFATNRGLFFQSYSDAYIKLTQFKVLTGSQGEIRSNCRTPK